MNKLFYKELTLLPDQEIATNFLMSKVMSALHLVCVEFEHRSGVVKLGIGFPEYSKEKRTLGNKVRLFATTSEVLDRTTGNSRLQHLGEYLRIGALRRTPDSVNGYVQYLRVQFKENKERLIRRYVQRHQMDLEETEKLYSNFKRPEPNLPYVTMNSLSSGQRFKLYISMVIQTSENGVPVFNSYGLIKTGSLPLF